MARVLMVQGTASAVGKSIVTTALCRIFARDGLRVAPFKSWNMALNSAVTPDGFEIGRSTAVQAEAAGIDPTADMNPVLIKPEAGGGAQTIVLGRPAPEMAKLDEEERRRLLWSVASGALDRLRGRYDLIVAEGAGSPAEINLRGADIANMRVALHAGARVLLVGDIDCGGVFASLLGTLMLLEPEERALVGGLIINRFRGDRSLLAPGLEKLEQLTSKPVLGVLPYMHGLRVADEDSVALDRGKTPGAGALDVAVIRLPHISNFDDFDLLAADPAVSLRFVAAGDRVGRPDLLILPGAKCTASDLEFARSSGLAAQILEAASVGVPIVGICGGYQMLGEEILDPLGVEGAGSSRGLGLLPARTTFRQEKRTRRVRAAVVAEGGWLGAAAGAAFDAYEIHMGETATDSRPLFSIASGGEPERFDGCSSPDGTICGTYLHGLFEGEAVRSALVRWLAARRGIAVESRPAPSREAQYDRLEEEARESLDIEAIRALVEEAE